MDPRLDTGGWLTLTETPYGLSSRQGLSPCKIRQAFPGAITAKLSRNGLKGMTMVQRNVDAVLEEGKTVEPVVGLSVWCTLGMGVN